MQKKQQQRFISRAIMTLLSFTLAVALVPALAFGGEGSVFVETPPQGVKLGLATDQGSESEPDQSSALGPAPAQEPAPRFAFDPALELAPTLLPAPLEEQNRQKAAPGGAPTGAQTDAPAGTVAALAQQAEQRAAVSALSAATAVDSWASFWNAWNDPNVSAIELTQSIKRGSTTNSSSQGNNLPALTRSLSIVGAHPGVVLDFGSSTSSGNAFTLGASTAARPARFELDNLTLARAGTEYLVNSSEDSTNTKGWTIALSNLSANATPTSPLVSVAGASVLLGGAVSWNNAGNHTQINASALMLADGAKVALSKSAGGNTLLNLVEGVSTGTGSSLSLQGGTTALSVSQGTSAHVSFGQGSALSIANATNGIMLPLSIADTAGNSSSIVFGEGSTADILVASKALQGTAVSFKANAHARLHVSPGATGSATLVDLGGSGRNIDYSFSAQDGAEVILDALEGNCLDVGGQDYSHSAQVSVTNKAKVLATGSGSGGGDSNAVIVANGARGGFTVTGGGVLEAHSRNETSSYPAMVEQIQGGVFTVSGAGSKLVLTQKNVSSRYTAVLRFRSVGNQTFDVSDGAEVHITRPAYTSGAHAAGIRFGSGANNTFNIHNGGHVYIYNGGAGSADSGSNSAGGNDAVEFDADGFAFYLQGTGPTGPSSCEIVADKGAAIDAASNGRGVISVGSGAVFIVTGNTGSASYPIFYANGSRSTFTMDNPLYYDFTNKRPGGGALATIASGGTWTSTNSDVALWQQGSTISGNPTASYTLIDYVLTSEGGSPSTWKWTSGDAGFQAWYEQNATHRLQNYTRISANNAPPVIRATQPATNANTAVRWLGTVAEGLNLGGRAFWDDEVFALVHVVKANGAEFDATVSATRSLHEETLYAVETNVAQLAGVLRLTKAGSEPGNTELLLEHGDSYQLVSYWRGDPSPTSPKRHVATDFSAVQPIVVADVVPPLPATNITPAHFAANQRALSGTWVPAAHDNPPVSVSAFIKRGAAAFAALPGTGTVSAQGSWSFVVPDDYTLAAGDVIAIAFTDANGNSEPLVQTALQDVLIPAAATITVEPAQYDIEGSDKTISLAEAQSITTPAQLTALIGAKGYSLLPLKTEVPLSIESTTYPYGSAVVAGDYSVTYRVVGKDYRESFYVHVDPAPPVDHHPVISFAELPLVIDQTPCAPHTLTSEELKAALQVTDAEDYPTWNSDADGRAQDLYKDMVATPLDSAGNATTIDTANIGVYKVRYVAKDATGNETTEYRAVVITDGRYIIEDEDEPKDGKNDIIIGARNFVIQQSGVERDEGHLKGLSYAEAFDVEGTPLAVALTPAGDDGIPAGYTTHTAAAGDYSFVWKAAGHPTTKTITGKVVVADELDPGTKDSQYAIYASHFLVNTVRAAAIIDGDPQTYIDEAKANIVKLVDSAPAKAVEVADRGNFKAEQGNYPITFVIAGIPANAQKVVIRGAVSDGEPPSLSFKTPLNIWVGEGAAPQGSITKEAYSAVAGNLYGVTATDPDGNGKNPSVAKDITSSVVATAQGAPVDLATVGTYVVRFSVTDADHNTATADRLVIVNDGRYTPGEGRVFYAKPFVILKSAVSTATDDTAKKSQVTLKSAAKLIAGTTESTSVHAGDTLPPDQTQVTSLGSYTDAVGVYDITFSAKDYPADKPNIGRTIKAEVVDAEVIESGPNDPNKDTYYIFGNNLALTPLEADAIQNSTDGLEKALLAALKAGARKSTPQGTLATLSVKVKNYDGFDARATGVQANGTYNVVVTDADENIAVTLKVVVASGNAPVLTVPAVKVVPVGARFEKGAYADATPSYLQGVSAFDVEDGAKLTANDVIIYDPATGNPVDPLAIVDTSVDKAVYVINYRVTDSAHNTATKQGVVLVGDWVVIDDYGITANDFSKEIGTVAGTEAEVLAASAAKGVDLRPELAPGIPNPAFGGEVKLTVINDGAYYTCVPGNFNIVVAVEAAPAVTYGIAAHVGVGASPLVTFTELPLVIRQTPLASHTLSQDELKAALTVTDAEDYPTWAAGWTNDNASGLGKRLFDSMAVTPLDESGQPAAIDTANIGVYKVRYTATDCTGNATTAYRAVVVSDGRYDIVDEDEPKDGINDLIIGARNFVVQQASVQRSEDHIKSLSYAEAFDTEGTALAVALDPAGDAGIPAGYTSGNAPLGSYSFTWRALGHTGVKAITGTVVRADVLDPGTKDSQYALYASHFMVNTAQAQDIIDSYAYSSAARAQVIKLVDSALTKEVRVNDLGTPPFAAVQGIYPISFVIDGIPAATQRVIINGVVTNGRPPVLSVVSPVHIWIGEAALKPAGALDPAEYDAHYGVSALDPDGGGKLPDVAVDVSASVVATATGPEVDSATAGTYLVHYSVEDADHNTAAADRLVVVNDGRYLVGAGRVLTASSFVIAADKVAATEADKLAQVRAETGAKLIAGSNESAAVRAGDVLPAHQIIFADLGGYSSAAGIYDLVIGAADYPATAAPLGCMVSAEVVDAAVAGSVPEDEPSPLPVPQLPNTPLPEPPLPSAPLPNAPLPVALPPSVVMQLSGADATDAALKAQAPSATANLPAPEAPIARIEAPGMTPLSSSTWSIASALLALFALVLGLVLVVSVWRRRNALVHGAAAIAADNGGGLVKRLRRQQGQLRAIGTIIVALSVVPAVLFWAFNDINTQAVLVNAYTILVATAAIAEAALVAIFQVLARHARSNARSALTAFAQSNNALITLSSEPL